MVEIVNIIAQLWGSSAIYGWMLLANCFVAPKVTKVVHFESKNCQNLFVSAPIFIQF